MQPVLTERVDAAGETHVGHAAQVGGLLQAEQGRCVSKVLTRQQLLVRFKLLTTGIHALANVYSAPSMG